MRISDWSSDVCSSDLLAANFAQATRTIAGCGGADAVAQQLGASVVSRDNIEMRALPAPLQATLVRLQVGQTTPPFGAPHEGVSRLGLCGRDMPQRVPAPHPQANEAGRAGGRERRRQY